MVKSRVRANVATFTILAPSSAGWPMVGSAVGVGLAVWDAAGLDVADGEGVAAATMDAESDRDGLAEPAQAATEIVRIRTPSCAFDCARRFIERR
jgi:hypothetical protein